MCHLLNSKAKEKQVFTSFLLFSVCLFFPFPPSLLRSLSFFILYLELTWKWVIKLSGKEWPVPLRLWAQESFNYSFDLLMGPSYWVIWYQICQQYRENTESSLVHSKVGKHFPVTHISSLLSVQSFLLFF